MLSPILQELLKRQMPDGGFTEYPGTGFRPDATAWATLALATAGSHPETSSRARARLESAQLADGQIPITDSCPESVWPTPLAIMAWAGSAKHRLAHDRAVTFLLNVSGKHWPQTTQSPIAHDTSLRGWPWVIGSHSWVEPTALSVLALSVAGPQNHLRLDEGRAMLINRQLPNGGWNYGNTFVYGQELEPMPDATGLALSALAGHVSQAMIIRSIEYLQDRAPQLQTPFSLAWALLGLGAWGLHPKGSENLIAACFDRRQAYGNYSTSHLSLLFLALVSKQGLTDFLSTADRG